MAPKRGKQPNRQATRRLTSVPAIPETTGVIRPDDDPATAGQPSTLVELPAALREMPDFVDPLGRQAVAGLAGCRTPLAAELALSEFLGLVELAVPELDRDEIAATQEAFLENLVGWAADQASAGPLSLLRVIEVLGVGPSRAAATAAAAQLTATGVLVEPPWAGQIGRPQIVRSWRYGDLGGAQESVSIMFAYGWREHVLCVLIDHLLGGGVKDCWVAEGRRAGRLRNDTEQEMATKPFAEFEDLPIPAAVRLLAAALANSPCPAQPDQIQDVARFLPLTRARLGWTATEAGVNLADLSSSR